MKPNNRLVAGVWLLAVVLAGTAHATHGGATYFDVLGYDEADAKVYLLETRWDAASDLPQLGYLALSSDEPTRLIVVRSWYEGDDANNRFADRLRELKARLKPLEAVSLAGTEIHTRIEQAGPCHEPQMWIWDCRDVQYEIRHGDRVAHLSARTWGFGDVVGLWSLPGMDTVLGIFRHRGHTHESGYDLDELVFLERAPPAAP